MAIYVEIVAPNGAVVKHHTVQKIEMFGAFATILLTVHSFTDNSVEAVGGMAQWCWSLAFAPDELKSMSRNGAETLLVNSPNSPFVGGAAVEDMSAFEAMVIAKKVQLKSARDTFEFGGFEWNGHRFDSDQISQQRIQGAVQMAMVAQATGEPFSIEWTLADNSVITLDGDQMLAVGLAMGQHIQAAHSKARLLKQQIDQAQSNEEIEAITW